MPHTARRWVILLGMLATVALIAGAAVLQRPVLAAGHSRAPAVAATATPTKSNPNPGTPAIAPTTGQPAPTPVSKSNPNPGLPTTGGSATPEAPALPWASLVGLLLLAAGYAARHYKR